MRVTHSLDLNSLELKEFGICFGNKVVLADITLNLPATGVTILMGPVGTGKSSLLCSLAGIHQNNPRFRYWGEVVIDGQTIDINGQPEYASTARQTRPILVRQQINQLTESLLNVILLTAKFSSMNNTIKNEFAANLIAEFDVPELLSMLSMRFIDIAPMWQRIALILGAATLKPPVLMIDEPTYGLNTEGIVRIKRFIKYLGTKIKLIVVLHSQEQAQDLADDIVLIAGGRVQFYGTCSAFFAKTPPNDVVRQFVQTGSVSIAAPDARREHLADDAVPPPPLPQAALDAIRFFNPPPEITETLPTDNLDQLIPQKARDINEKVINEAEAEKLQIVKALEAQVEAIRAKKAAQEQLELTQQKLAQDSLTQLHLEPNFESSHQVTQADIKAQPDTVIEASSYALETPKNATLTTEHIQPLLELPKPSKDGVSIVAGIGKQDTSVSRGPAGFSWVVPGMIAGCPMPGVSAPMGYDLDLLANIGITVLITLTEEDIYQAELVAAGLSNVHLPIYDREAPSLSQMHMLLLKMQKLIAQGEVLAVHCLAGLGRTGTVLAAWMIKEGGLSAEEAIRRLRLINPGFIQSAVQENFLAEFENDILRRMR